MDYYSAIEKSDIMPFAAVSLIGIYSKEVKMNVQIPVN